MRSGWVVAGLVAGTFAAAPAAHADDSVTYEVISGYVHSADIEYRDRSELISLQGVPLPWRMNASVVDPASESVDGTELRAKWQTANRHSGCEGPSCPAGISVPFPSWVTIRVYVRGSLFCESSLDTGNASCKGYTPSEGDPPPAKREGAAGN